MSVDIVLFGDSLTAGFYNQRVSSLLTERIERYYPSCQIMNAGIPGDNTRNALERIEADVLQFHPKIVTVFFGANDVSINKNVPLEEYKSNLQQIITRIGPEKVVLLTPPYVDQTKRSQDRPIRNIIDYVAGAEEIAQRNGLSAINVCQSMLVQPSVLDLFQPDGLHFSLSGYNLLARLIETAIDEKIAERGHLDHE